MRRCYDNAVWKMKSEKNSSEEPLAELAKRSGYSEPVALEAQIPPASEATTWGNLEIQRNSSNRIRLAIAWILFLNVMCGLDTDATNIVIKILLPLA